MLHKLETVLTNIKQPQHPEMVKDVLTFYGSDFHQSDRAVSERSFSALRRLKSRLCTTTCQARPNWCMILHAHKDKTDSLQLNSVANEFV